MSLEHRKRQPEDILATNRPPDWWSWLMISLSLVFLAGYSLLILSPNLPTSIANWTLLILMTVWVIFIGEYVVAFHRSQEGWKFLPRHWLMTLSLIIPIMRPFVLLRYVNQLKYFRAGSGSSMRWRIIISAVAFATLFIYVISITVLRFERDAPGATITSFGDAIWWAFVTIATVGYGDEYPITIPGRFFAIVLMIGGVAIVGTASALVVSYLNEQTQKALKKHAEQHPDKS